MTATATITRTLDTYPGETRIDHLWSITIDGERIAELWVEIATGEILNVWTHEDHRGQGHATALYQQAASEIDIFHAPVSHRTDDGNRFAERVGGLVMPDCNTCCANLYADEDGDQW
ncbi:GNAT family N-acetyltransferase [Micromonospora inyonensis]|nr:GNAT family N-acetyltransferase [Micromonospora inyonensis]